MNRANFYDMFKSIIIIILFIAMISIMTVASNPNIIKKMICKMCNSKEGYQNTTVDECSKCIIIPTTPDRPIQNIINRGNNEYDFSFEYNKDNYVFSMWRENNFNKLNKNCDSLSQRLQRAIYGLSCCSTSDNDRTPFYLANYIQIENRDMFNIIPNNENNNKEENKDEDEDEDRVVGKKFDRINGILFKLTSRYVGNNSNKKQEYIVTFNPVTLDDFDQQYDGRDFRIKLSNNEMYLQNRIGSDNFKFNYSTDRNLNKNIEPIEAKIIIDLTNPNNTQQITIGDVNYGINCNGNLVKIRSKDRYNYFEDCDIVNELSLEQVQRNNNCWKLLRNGTNNGRCVMRKINDNCKRIFLPKDENDNGEPLPRDPNEGTESTPYERSDITDNVRSRLQEVVDKLVNKFRDRLDSLTDERDRERLEFPNIGNPVFLNIGSCLGRNYNQRYLDSACFNNNNKSEKDNEDNEDNDTIITDSGGFLFKHTCRPSITGAFDNCGPKGVLATL